MIVHTSPLFQIFFGDQRTACVPGELRGKTPLKNYEPFTVITQELETRNIALLNQVHGVDGVCVEDAMDIPPFVQEGDYLLTNQRHIGLGVVTADCVPVVLYDKVHHAVVIIHAGWRGLVQGVITEALEHMKRSFATDPAVVKAFVGPCAKACCYTVGNEVIHALDAVSFKDRVLCDTEHGVHFDMPLFVQLQLREQGVPASSCTMDYNQCTVCADGLCSVRRTGTSQRNITVVVLK